MFTRRPPSSILRRLAQWGASTLLATGALVAIAAPALASTPTTHASTTHSVHPPVSRATTTTTPVTPATLTSRLGPEEPGGVCQVPGIGDVGALIQLCQQGSSGLIGDLNNICQPALPQPEQATAGLDNMIQPPQSASGGKTLYDNYGVAGQYWAAHDMQCSDMTSLVGNNVAGMVFDAAKALDRVTITVYQSAAGDSILTWLRDAVNRLITALGNAIYFPYLAPVVLLGAVWLAWQGLVRKRATRTIEGTIWMVVAATAAIALIGRPADFTNIGTGVSNGVTQVLNTAFAKLPSPGSSDCLPVQAGDKQSVTANYNFTSGNGLVDQNADELWSVLVCKPWLYGELGTTQYAAPGAPGQTVVNQYGRQLLWSQAVAVNETATSSLISAKQATYNGIAGDLKQSDPAVYPLFQGNQWTTRLEIAFAAIFAALVAGLLILLIALTLIVLKLGFLLLLVAGPFFLIIGTHPGFGRIIAIRWFEMIVGVLMKQVAIAIVLSVLLYCYSLIMGTSDSVLPWALKILMIALVTVTVFIYRRPFQHLFSAVGYGTIGSQERADLSLREASDGFRRSTINAATGMIPGVAGYRAARWARRGPGQATVDGAGAAAGVAMAGTAEAAAGHAGAAVETGDAYPSRLRPDAPPPVEGAGDGVGRHAVGAGAARTRAASEAADSSGRTAPPLDLPSRGSGGGAGSSRWPGTTSRSAGTSNGSASRGNGSVGGATSGSGGSAPSLVGSGSAAGSSTSGASGTSSGTSSGGATGSGSAGSGAGSAAAGWSRGAGRSAGARGRSGPLSSSRSTGASAGSPPPLRSSGSSGTGSGGSQPWPGSGAPRSGTGQQPTRRRTERQPKAPAENGGNGGNGGDGRPSSTNANGGEQSARPFWLRSPRRDKK